MITDGLAVYSDPAVIDDFPDVRFGLIDEVAAGTNATSVLFANEQGGDLAGAVAALTSQTGVVGFIGGAAIPSIEEFRAGFEAGVAGIDPDATVLSTYVRQPGDEIDGGSGFANPDRAAARARALYQRDADVVFAAAGNSGFGVFEEAAAYSARSGQHVWAIGVDNDQWYDVPSDQRPYVLTSIIKRGDVAAQRLVEIMLDDGPSGVVLRLGVEDGGFDYSRQGDALSDGTVAVIDELVADMASGTVAPPKTPSGPVLLLDDDGSEVESFEDVSREPVVGVDGLPLGEVVPIRPARRATRRRRISSPPTTSRPGWRPSSTASSPRVPNRLGSAVAMGSTSRSRSATGSSVPRPGSAWASSSTPSTMVGLAAPASSSASTTGCGGSTRAKRNRSRSSR